MVCNGLSFMISSQSFKLIWFSIYDVACLPMQRKKWWKEKIKSEEKWIKNEKKRWKSEVKWNPKIKKERWKVKWKKSEREESSKVMKSNHWSSCNPQESKFERLLSTSLWAKNQSLHYKPSKVLSD